MRTGNRIKELLTKIGCAGSLLWLLRCRGPFTTDPSQTCTGWIPLVTATRHLDHHRREDRGHRAPASRAHHPPVGRACPCRRWARCKISRDTRRPVGPRPGSTERCQPLRLWPSLDVVVDGQLTRSTHVQVPGEGVVRPPSARFTPSPVPASPDQSPRINSARYAATLVLLRSPEHL